MLGTSNKTEVEVKACFDLAAADISDLGCSGRDGGSLTSLKGEFPMSFWFLLSDLWVYL